MPKVLQSESQALEVEGRLSMAWIPDKVDAVWEGIHRLLLLPHVIDPDLWVRDTTAEPGLGVGLVLDLSVALGWSCTTQPVS